MLTAAQLKEYARRSPRLYRVAKRFFFSKTRVRRITHPAFFWPVFRSLRPISEKYGFDRGKPVDRQFIEQFLLEHSQSIRGACLEVKDREYTSRYGRENVITSDVLDINVGNKRANIHGDLRKLTGIQGNSYDCIILTQVLQYIDDIPSAIGECHRILKPDGVLLATLPSLGRIDLGAGVGGDYWRFTTASARYLFGQCFKNEQLAIQSWGNVLSGVGFWIGLACEDMRKKAFEYTDENFPVLITVVAKK